MTLEVTFVGHACFLCTAPGAPRVLLDPYRAGALGGRIGLDPVGLGADVVAISHFHEDHGWFGALPGRPSVADRSGVFRGVPFEMLTTPHDGCCGTQMGLSRMMRFSLGGRSILHPGDLGTLPSSAVLASLAPVDLLLLPVGGRYTLEPPDALRLADALRPRWVIPMHYRSAEVDLPMATLDEFVTLAADRLPLHRADAATVRFDDRRAEGLWVLDALRRGRR